MRDYKPPEAIRLVCPYNGDLTDCRAPAGSPAQSRCAGGVHTHAVEELWRPGTRAPECKLHGLRLLDARNLQAASLGAFRGLA